MTNAIEEVLAVIIGRAGSKGLPRKNALMVADAPMIAHTIRFARASSTIDRVIVSTDGDEIAQIAADEGRFELTAVVTHIADKMVRRHPHVFAEAAATTTDDVRRHWQTMKQQEKPARQSQLEGIPLALPELARAARITARAAAVGYDFPDRRMLFDKLTEELTELSEELFGTAEIPHVPATVDASRVPDEPMTDLAARDRAESELGDVLFVLANIGRRWGINPEDALRRSNAKFSRRFQAIEAAMKAQGLSMKEATLVEMEAAYQAAKSQEKNKLS